MPDNKYKPFDVIVDQKKLNSLQNKLSKYPYYAIQQGMIAATDYLNDIDMVQMYPPESDEPFIWSSDRQRKAYFASDGFGGGIPYSRTYDLADSGEFTYHAGEEDGPYSTISYSNPLPYSDYVIGANIIIGLRKRGWKPVNKFVITRSRDVGEAFRRTVLNTWQDMDRFVSSGGGGL